VSRRKIGRLYECLRSDELAYDEDDISRDQDEEMDRRDHGDYAHWPLSLFRLLIYKLNFVGLKK